MSSRNPLFFFVWSPRTDGRSLSLYGHCRRFSNTFFSIVFRFSKCTQNQFQNYMNACAVGTKFLPGGWLFYDCRLKLPFIITKQHQSINSIARTKLIDVVWTAQINFALIIHIETMVVLVKCNVKGLIVRTSRRLFVLVIKFITRVRN